jgi:hypothetical protein
MVAAARLTGLLTPRLAGTLLSTTSSATDL